MIRFIFGGQGCGKTSLILDMLRRDADEGVPSLLIVPEQEAVIAERLTLDKLPPMAQLTLEVLNFSRLYNRVCHEAGGLCYSYITKPLKHVIMWRALREVSPFLKEYGANALSDPAFVGTALSAVSELKYACVSHGQLEEAAEDCEELRPSLSARLKDLSYILGAYEMLVNEKYSDSSDDLSKLCDILDEYSFFEGKNVYIDSFTSFTAVEHRVIERIFKSAKNTVITVPLHYPDYSDISTASIERSLMTLKKNAGRWGGHEDTVLPRERKNIPIALSYLADGIWDMGRTVAAEDRPSCDGHIVMEICDNPYAEAEATASHIRELLIGGARCRDIVITMRDASKYRGIIEPALEKADIPFYISEKTDICALAPVKFILSAVRIRQYGWKRNDVISHIKTGLCDIDGRTADVFEEYINTWNIFGTRFTDGDWSMNPDGYTGRLTERGKLILREANAARRALVLALEKFFVLLDSADTIPDMCRAVYAYIQESALREKTLELAKREMSFGNKKAAAELASVYDIILKTLADVGEALSDMPASIDDFYNILKTIFEQTEVGTIPTSVDEVTVGSASLLRSQNPDHVFVLGLCEGEFPAAVDDTGILGSNDRNILCELGIDLGADEDTRSSDELMFVKNAFSMPRKKLYLFTSLADTKGSDRTPSLPFRRTAAMFSDLTPHRFSGNDISYLCGSPKSAAAHLRNIDSEADKRAVTLAVSEHLPLVTALADASASSSECRVDPQTVKTLIGDKIYISPSSLEKYVRCPFSFYAGHMLSLRERAKASFGTNNIGDFVHYVMEHIISFAIPEGESDERPTDEQVIARVGEIVEEYIRLISPDDALKTKRMQHLYSKLRRLSLLIAKSVIDELSDSDFRPAFFEFHIDGKDGNPAPLDIPLDNGARLILKGYIDRVDLWKDGDKVYVRIVDYKTGSKQFELSDLEVGLNTQMLLYLFAVCRDPGATLTKKCDTELSAPASLTPASVVYLSSAFPKIKLNSFDTDDTEIMDMATQGLSRNGLILDDERIINAVSHSHSKELLMGVTQKDGRYIGKPLISEESFGELYRGIEQTLTKIGNDIYSGLADSAPLAGEDPCKYCKVAPMCRKDDFGKRRGKR